eukprot:TRINITY_DN6638_c0_g3_i1.p1 TRINITY_DN6638_c0_g3~~TRINITY_DN6638_c0_g3_i1.p1  ORF type:complete len:346 (+),score=80.59 TRINITY_DN6638_c0_g3_i1:1-1038(+)
MITYNKTLCMWLVVFYFSGVLANLFFKKETNSMAPNYAAFVAAFNPFAFALIYILPLLYRLWKGQVSDESRQFPKYRFLYLSILDAISNIIELTMSESLGKDAGPQMTLLNQGAIPITLILSFIILRKKYNRFQVIGAIIVLGGLFFCLIPTIQKVAQSEKRGGKQILFELGFLSKNIPHSLSSILKEVLFRKIQMDLLYLSFWEQALIVPFGVLLTFVYLPIADITGSAIPKWWRGAFRCMVGLTTLEGDTCHNSMLNIVFFNLSSSMWFVSSIGVIRYGSANAAFIAAALMMPVCNLLFSSKVIMGDDASVASPYSWGGLWIILFGMILYAMGNKTIKKQSSH